MQTLCGIRFTDTQKRLNTLPKKIFMQSKKCTGCTNVSQKALSPHPPPAPPAFFHHRNNINSAKLCHHCSMAVCENIKPQCQSRASLIISGGKDQITEADLSQVKWKNLHSLRTIADRTLQPNTTLGKEGSPH